MDIVYRAFGESGGSWRSHIFTRIDSNIQCQTNFYKGLRDAKELVHNDVQKLRSAVDIKEVEEIRFRTDLNINEARKAVQLLKESDANLDIETFYRPQKYKDMINTWELSDLLCDYGLYEFNLEKEVSRPYTIYTDASYWPDIERASIGFVISGSDNSILCAVGCPVRKNIIHDNNIAEFYAALSSLYFVKHSVQVQILTDSKNLCVLLSDEKDDFDSNIAKRLLDKKYQYSNLEVDHVERKRVEICDRLARMGKKNPISYYPK
jgi:ribonuclease HI